MNIIESVKAAVTSKRAAEHYGIESNRFGMARCQFHDDRTPSMKLDARFHCFGCQAGYFIESNYGIRFTTKHIREMLRKKGFRHAKPYDVDYRRPADAEATFKKESEQPWIL